MKLPSLASALQTRCDEFNAKYPVGTAVTLHTDTKGDIETKTRSEAQVLSGHSAVVWLEGVSGCYDLGRVTISR